ncbi:hypothetical protein [Solemya elarraichensis gill symbiont]|uniref:hypothetical protein n=1 Tax=Solemya elarraichensis gill symbiont TaxID=1918949 RepID=UPI00108438B9|nr:hypothetical protein [Solemya elarraichensis gill symbiont]
MNTLELIEQLKTNKRAKTVLQQDFVQWIAGKAGTYTHAVTLTFPFEVTDADEVEKYLAFFSRKINSECCRRPKEEEKVKMALVIHGINSSKKLHVHAAIQSPDKISSIEMSRRIKKSWHKALHHKRAIVDIKTYDDDGWIGYISKEFTLTNTRGISQYCNF